MIPFPEKKYNIIYADPPWKFKAYSDAGNGKGAQQHYDCMTLEDIKALPVDKISAEDCVLFLWVTFPTIQQGFEVISEWGFVYKTVAFNWVKKNKKSDGLFWGLGFWTRSNSEICLLATKGHPKRESAKVHQVVLEPVREHSRKPDTVRKRIVELVGDLPRIELFARQSTPGWDVWGNEINVFKEGVADYDENRD